MPKVKRGWPVCRSTPIMPRKKPTNRLVSPRTDDEPSTAETMTKASTISEKYSAGPKASAKLTTTGARKATPERAERAGDEGADRRGGECCTAAAGAGHSVALQRGDDGSAFARRVEQDRCGRAAIHGAVVDAGEQDEGGFRRHLDR